MPRPPLELVALSEISSIPQASSAATSFMSESTLPRMTPSLASIRWIVHVEHRTCCPELSGSYHVLCISCYDKTFSV
jgi:hypothetical protein